MTSARQFCRESEYPIAVFLTYSFDPLFFERVPLADLAIGGSRRIVIAADAGQVAEAMRRCMGQIVHLGRRYVLADSAGTNTFHPKLIARLSAEGGRVWLGSGNLTYTGWGGNRELATSWAIGPQEEDKGVWLDELLNAVAGVVGSTSFADQLHAIRAEARWLTARLASPSPTPVLVGMLGRPLAPQLAARWGGRRFDEVKLCTGSTDTDGAFLAWAQRTFGVRRATVCLTPAQASFDPVKLARVPIEIRIVEANAETEADDAGKMMHAKFYWFSGREGQAAVVGSANCSAAAWFGGNVELIVPYDSAPEVDFASALTVFRKRALPPEKALAGRVPSAGEEATGAPSRYRLVSLRLRAGKVVEAVLDPPPDRDACVSVFVQHGSQEIAVRLSAQPRCYAGRLPDEFQFGGGTAFARAEIASGGVSYGTEPRWIDNDIALHRSSMIRAVDPNLQDLSRGGFLSTNQQRILEAIRAVSSDLLMASTQDSSSAAQPRPSGSEKEESAEGDDRPAALDPVAMVRRLQDLKRERHADLGGRFFPNAGTLEGVVAMLFEQEDHPEDMDLGRESWAASEPEKDPEANGATSGHGSGKQNTQEPDEQTASAETLLRFKKQLATFLDELAKPAFADSCVPARMVQALAFPLLLGVQGTEAEWLPAGELSLIATRVSSIMLDRRYAPDVPRGLLRRVQQRYATLGRLNEFRSVVGDGTLWTALLAALVPVQGAPLRALIPQAAALADVLQCRDLLADVDAARMSGLVQSVRIKNAEANIIERAPRIAEAATALKAILSARWDEFYKKQGNGRRRHRAGSLLWSREWGWEVTPNSPAETYRWGYIELEVAAASSAEVQDTVARLTAACAVASGGINV